MKNTIKKITAVITMLAIVLTMAVPAQVEAKAKPKLNKKSVTLTITDKKTAPAATLKIGNVSKKEMKKAVWKSSNKKVATVNKNGKITAKKNGKTTVTVKVNGRTLSCKVTVLDKRTPKEEPEPSEQPEKPAKCSHQWEEHWTVFEAEGDWDFKTQGGMGVCYCGVFSHEEFQKHIMLVAAQRDTRGKMERMCGIHGTKAKPEGSSHSVNGMKHWTIRTEYIDYFQCTECGLYCTENGIQTSIG